MLAMMPSAPRPASRWSGCSARAPRVTVARKPPAGGPGSLNRYVLDRRRRRALRLEVSDVGVDQRACREQALALERVPVLLELRGRGDADHVRRSANRAERDTLVLDLRRPSTGWRRTVLERGERVVRHVAEPGERVV